MITEEMIVQEDWYKNISYKDAKMILTEKLQNMSMNLVATGYYMKYIRDNGLYKEDGYTSIWEFAEDTYGIKRTTASRWMAINDKFSKDGNSPILDEPYREYNRSQLQELLYLDDKQMEQVTPEMTVKEIREVRKPVEEEPEDTDVAGLEKPSETIKLIINFFSRQLIRDKYDYFKENISQRVLNVISAETLLKHEIKKEPRSHMFYDKQGRMYQINLWDEYIELYGHNNVMRGLIGRYEWFYLMASIQSQWNVVTFEEIQKQRAEECATSHTDDELPGQMHIEKDYPEFCPEPIESIEEDDVLLEEPEQEDECDVVESAVVVEEPVVAEPVQSEVVSEVDETIELAKIELVKEQSYLDLTLKEYGQEGRLTKKVKVRVAALTGFISDLELVKLQNVVQPELPQLKNNDQRKEFLHNFHEWPVWFNVPEADETYYRYDLTDGTSIVVCEYKMYSEWKKFYKEDPESVDTRLYLLPVDYHYLNGCKTNESALIEHLKNLQKGDK